MRLISQKVSFNQVKYFNYKGSNQNQTKTQTIDDNIDETQQQSFIDTDLERKSALSLNIIEHEFIYKESADNNKLLIEHNNLNIKINKIEDEPIKCNFLVKFNEKGHYAMRIEAEYKVLKSDIYDDYFIMKYSGNINFEVIDPFNIKFE